MTFALCLTINPQGKDLMLRLNTASRFLGMGRTLGIFMQPAKYQDRKNKRLFLLSTSFRGKKDKPLSWSAISNFTINLTDLDTKSQIPLIDAANNKHLLRIEMIMNASGLLRVEKFEQLTFTYAKPPDFPKKLSCNHWSFHSLSPQLATQ